MDCAYGIRIIYFAGSEDKTLKLVDLKVGKVTKELTGLANDVIVVLKLAHP